MSGPPPPGYYPPPGQHPPPPGGAYLPYGHQPPLPGQYPSPGQHPPPPAGLQGQYPPPPGQHGPPPIGPYPAQPYPQAAGPPPYTSGGGYYPPPYAGMPSPAQAAFPPVPPGGYPGQQFYPGYGPAGLQPPAPGAAPHQGHPHVDVESDDSDPSEFALYSREDKHPLAVKFTNRTGKMVQLFWINKKGRRKRKGKLKDGQSKTIDTFESHIFMAISKKVSREPLLINGSPLFYAFPYQHGNKHVSVEITKPSTAHSIDQFKSVAHVTIPVEVKFVNRSGHEVQLDWVTPHGRREKKKGLPKGRCWRTTSWEGHCWVCCDPKRPDHLFVLNFGRHYRVQKSRRARERVVITKDMKVSGSSSSSSSSSSSD